MVQEGVMWFYVVDAVLLIVTCACLWIVGMEDED